MNVLNSTYNHLMNKLVDVAKKYIGQTEKPGNMGFTDAEFEKKMQAVGFQKTHAWCSYFVELCLKEAYPEKFAEFDKLCSGSAVQTFKNFQNAGYLIGYVPCAGHVVVWQQMKEGQPLWSGHIGIVSSVQDNNWIFESIEGNTNDEGGREGYIVAEKTRKHLADVKDGLKIIGFIQPV